MALRVVARQAPLSRGFYRQEYWSELPCPPPGDLPDPGIKPTSHYVSIGKLGSLPGKISLSDSFSRFLWDGALSVLT